MTNIKFCSECGQKLEEGVKFCPNCGNALSAKTVEEAPQSNAYTPNYTPGFSTRINDPEIMAALKKNRKISRILLLILLPVPIIGAAIYALVTKEMELGQALIYGAVISGIILIINILSGMSHGAKHGYEAVVIDKREEYTSRSDEDRTLVYKTIVRTTDGHKKVIEDTSHMPRSAYEYLCVGDRFRYHPQLAYPYEKFEENRVCICNAE